MNPGSDAEHRPASVPKLAWGKEEKEGPGAAPAQQPEEVEQFQPLQKGAAVQRTREQERTRGRFRRTAQVPAAIPTWAGPAGTAQPSTVLGALHATSRASCPSATDGLQIHEEDSGGREQRRGHCGQSVLSHLQNQGQCCPAGYACGGGSFQPKASEQPVAWLFSSQQLRGLPSHACCSLEAFEAMAVWWQGKHFSGAAGHIPSSGSFPSLPCLLQVPAMVRYIHQWLVANEFPEYNLYRPLLDLTEAQPCDVVMALLRVAPVCDRAALAMWKSIMCSPRTAEPAMLVLLEVLGSWPEHSTCTSDGDHTAVLALAATVVMWKILQLPCVPHVVTVCFPCLFVHLLFQVLFSTLDMPEEVDTFWKGCQQQHGLATNPSSFAEQTLKALLCRLHYEDVVVAMEDKGGWDTLLCADTHHCAVGVLAREMRRASEAVCSAIAFQLLGLLSKDTPCRDLAALAFLVEVLERLNLSECRDSVLEFLSKNLQSECRGRRRLALRGLVVLGTTSASMARRMWSLHERLVELLQENDGVMLRMTTVLLRAVFLCNGAPITSALALQLAEALLPLFDNEDSQVQLSSMFIFRDMLDRFPEEEKKALKAHVRQSLLPLSFHCHDENQRVAEASQETLLCAAEFLKQRDLEKLLKNQKLWKFTECLLAEDSSSVAEHLRRALPYLQSPQEPLREAAVRFMGTAGRYLRGRKEELQLISEALEGMANDISVPVASLAVQTLYVLQEAERAPYSIFDNLHDRLRRAWRRRPRLSGLGWLRCWSSAES
nr:uncharacterized protein LOC116807173 isoform X1 [Taeniopygia guttata]XP_041568721.1 uncharacterized protein LOC116807173 isoform X1 [Taeniopygia guttata]XP_041568722.1 uncharacterized protein LOC116807173 isoform X1 [Taeniopygia guttata]XP_041568723.1 uncharacterized protein LOC116807173 isoform X1 [Taeniopygia guttata]